MKKELQFLSIITPILELFVAVFAFDVPKTRFDYWSIAVLICELLIYFVYHSLKD